MRVAVIGGGASGHAISRALSEHGAAVEVFSRSSGFDVLHDEAPPDLRDAEAIVEATGHFVMSRKAATDFFTRSTRAIAAVANRSGARHILLSIVNCDLPEVQGYGYFAGKAAQERVARAESARLTIIRSTQWFEFAGQNLERMRLGPVAAVPGMRIKPVALGAVASVIAESVLGSRPRGAIEISGPDVTTLWAMTTALADRTVIPVPLRIPGSLGRAFREGALLPMAGTEVVGPRFEDWLAREAG